jgi:AMP-binding enzyme
MHVAGCYQRLLGLTPDDVTAICLPVSYVSGHVSQLNPFLLAGGSAVILPRFGAAEMTRLLSAHRVTVIDVVPSMFALLLREPGFCQAARPAPDPAGRPWAAARPDQEDRPRRAAAAGTWNHRPFGSVKAGQVRRAEAAGGHQPECGGDAEPGRDGRGRRQQVQPGGRSGPAAGTRSS